LLAGGRDQVCGSPYRFFGGGCSGGSQEGMANLAGSWGGADCRSCELVLVEVDFGSEP